MPGHFEVCGRVPLRLQQGSHVGSNGIQSLQCDNVCLILLLGLQFHSCISYLNSASNSARYTMSAKLDSIRRKYARPVISNRSTTVAETQMSGPGYPAFPSSAQRKPSTTPAIGLNAYKDRQRSALRLLG